MPVANMAYNDNDCVQVNTLTPLMESMDTPRIFKGPISNVTINQYGSGETTQQHLQPNQPATSIDV